MTNRGQEPTGRSGEKAEARKSKGESPKQGRRARKGETVMKLVQGNGINYEVRGQCEEEAAFTLEEGLNQVSKRRSAYVESNLEAVIDEVRSGYGVEVRAVLQ